MTYWDNMLSSRISRRRSLAMTGGGAAAAFLVACSGGGSDEPAKKQEPASALPKQVDTTKQAVAGGELHERIATDSNYYLYDSNFNTSGNPGIAGWIYPHLTKVKGRQRRLATEWRGSWRLFRELRAEPGRSQGDVPYPAKPEVGPAFTGQRPCRRL